MRSTFASRAFSALIYCQALLVFAGVASVLLRDRPTVHDVARVVADHGPADDQSRL